MALVDDVLSQISYLSAMGLGARQVVLIALTLTPDSDPNPNPNA